MASTWAEAGYVNSWRGIQLIDFKREHCSRSNPPLTPPNREWKSSMTPLRPKRCAAAMRSASSSRPGRWIASGSIVRSSGLQQRGFRTKTYGDIYRSRGYLAGDDTTRADELMAAFRDPETSAVWCARGGYGVARLLDRIDFDVIRRHPKVFVGFSDITALHLAIHKRTGLVTFHGPNLQDGFGKTDDMLAANETALWRAVWAEEQSRSAERLCATMSVGMEQNSLHTIRPGRATRPAHRR